jgi:predicted RNA-binding Zn-ribbon protein involved in translation (DUF1610 family)
MINNESESVDAQSFKELLNTIVATGALSASRPVEFEANVRDFIIQRVTHYANTLKFTPLEILTAMEDKRTFCVGNYYTESHFPRLDGGDVFILRDLEHYRQIVGVTGFRCPRCGEISLTDPYHCTAWSGKTQCGWKAFGFMGCLGNGLRLIVREAFLLEPFVYEIFMPIALEPLFEDGKLIPGATFPE